MSGRTKRNVAEYRWEGTNDDGNSTVYEKWIVVEYDENADDDSLTVTFAASQRENTTFDELPESFDDWQDVKYLGDKPRGFAV